MSNPNIAPGPGRPVGSKNHFPGLLQKAIAAALTEHGADGQGKDGLKGFVHWALLNYPKEMISIVGRMLPRSIILEEAPEEEEPRPRRTVKEIRAEFEAAGFTVTDAPPPPAIVRNAPIVNGKYQVLDPDPDDPDDDEQYDDVIVDFKSRT